MPELPPDSSALTPLPFTLRRVRTPADLAAAIQVRAQAYGHHLPQFGATLSEPDAVDLAPGTWIMLARHLASGTALGTVRMQLSHRATLSLEHCVTLPPALRTMRRAEVTRLAIVPGSDSRLRMALFEACWRHARAQGVRVLLAAARRPALLRIYEQLGFVPLTPEDPWVELPHAGHLPHRVRHFYLDDDLGSQLTRPIPSNTHRRELTRLPTPPQATRIHRGAQVVLAPVDKPIPDRVCPTASPAAATRPPS